MTLSDLAAVGLVSAGGAFLGPKAIRAARRGMSPAKPMAAKPKATSETVPKAEPKPSPADSKPAKERKPVRVKKAESPMAAAAREREAMESTGQWERGRHAGRY